MSAENNPSSRETSPPYEPSTSQYSTQTLSSEEEDKEEDENSERKSLSPEHNEYLEDGEYLEEEILLEEDEYLEEEKFLEGNTYLYESEYLKERKHLQEKKLLEEKEFLLEKYLEDEFKSMSSYQTLPHLTTRSVVTGPSKGTTLSAVPPSTSELPYESLYSDSTPSTSYVQRDGDLLAWQNQSTQTEWIYETPTKSRLKAQEISRISLSSLKSGSEVYAIPDTSHEEENVLDFVTKESFWDDLLNEPIDSLEAEGLDDKLFSSSYQAVFRTMLKEMAARKELEEDIDVPLTGILESETRRKLGILLKKNFGNYRETILWIMKKREHLLNARTTNTSTFTLQLWNQPPQIRAAVTEVKKSRPVVVRPKKKVEIDTEWIQSTIKVSMAVQWCFYFVHHALNRDSEPLCTFYKLIFSSQVHAHDGKLILYPSETVFQVLLPDGSGQIHYPSGRLAMLILSTKDREYTYIILDDSEERYVRALINNCGHATFYDENGEIWLSMSQNLGYYFPKGKHQKAWNWWNLTLHVHAPPVQSISLKINRYIKVQIRSQDKIAFCFRHQKKHVCLNLGTKYKFIMPEVLSEMRQKAILEVECGSTARKIQILLGKMSRILNFLTIPDLEKFIEDAQIVPVQHLDLKNPHLPE
ncbi:glutamate-rich protein 6B [Vulpes vulpes]|uniref:Glutamate-rich protein 6B n=1 Tax=Vulpes vulpes TaxID=9627 RepID=A0ABM5AV24_VULVU